MKPQDYSARTKYRRPAAWYQRLHWLGLLTSLGLAPPDACRRRVSILVSFTVVLTLLLYRSILAAVLIVSSRWGCVTGPSFDGCRFDLGPHGVAPARRTPYGERGSR
jgi:hypothetical protein